MVYSCIENDYPLTLVKEEVNNYGKKRERKFHLQISSSSLPIEKKKNKMINKYTKLDENKILELIKQIGTEKVQ